MERNWRPDNWDTKRATIKAGSDYYIKNGKAMNEFGFFEAGADALYEAIWKLAEESPTGTYTFVIKKEIE